MSSASICSTAESSPTMDKTWQATTKTEMQKYLLLYESGTCGWSTKWFAAWCISVGATTLP